MCQYNPRLPGFFFFFLIKITDFLEDIKIEHITLTKQYCYN
jgi:hypothetical protein